MDRRLTFVALPYVSKQGFAGAFLRSLLDAIATGDLRDAQFHHFEDMTQIAARNSACEKAIQSGARHLLFIDSDMDFPPYVLSRLKACDADIACTDMWTRRVPSIRCVSRGGYPVENGEGIIDVDACGMACTLIRVSLLERLKAALHGRALFHAAEYNEDGAFCLTAQKLAGATIRCDFDMVAGHWGAARFAGEPWSRDAKDNPMPLDPKDVDFARRAGVTNLPEIANHLYPQN